MISVAGIVRSKLPVIVGALICCSAPAAALTVPFVEDFVADVASWRDAPGTGLLDWSSSGGPDGGSYASTTFNFENSLETDTPALFRAQDEFNSSGGAFFGDWMTGIGGFSVYVRHDAPQPLEYFVRYAVPTNFPAAVSPFTQQVQPGVWTRLTAPVLDPDTIFEGDFVFEDVFDDVGHVQVGIFVTPELALQNVSYTFDIDKVSISEEFIGPHVPTTSEWGLAILCVALVTAASLILRQRSLSNAF